MSKRVRWIASAKKWTALFLIAVIFCIGCGTEQVDDYATNDGYDKVSEEQENTTASKKIAKEDIKVGVLHISDPADGSGYSYTHDLGIQGMQENLGLSAEQIVRKVSIADSDEAATKKAIEECIEEGCNIIFTTSWGYMKTTAEMAEKYPDVYFAHGTGYKFCKLFWTNLSGTLFKWNCCGYENYQQ